MKYVNLTPRWTEILPTWRFMVESVTTRDDPSDVKDPTTVMMNFWDEMKRMAQGADNYNDLLTYLRKTQGWKDDRIEQAIVAGCEANEIERNTIREASDAL